jgi:hypothetical protein
MRARDPRLVAAEKPAIVAPFMVHSSARDAVGAGRRRRAPGLAYTRRYIICYSAARSA